MTYCARARVLFARALCAPLVLVIIIGFYRHTRTAALVVYCKSTMLLSSNTGAEGKWLPVVTSGYQWLPVVTSRRVL